MPLPLQAMRENEQADDFGHLVLALVYCRMKRMLYFWRGWPNRSAEFLGPSGQKVMNELREDYKMYELYKNSTDPNIQKLILRSSFTDVSVIQLVRMCETHKWCLTPELTAWITKGCETNVTSLINEDGFNRQKHKCSMARTHKGRPQRAFGTLIDEHVADEVHHFVEVRPEPLTHSRTPLPGVAFSPTMKNPSIPEMTEIVGKSHCDKADWYSPGVGELPTEHADHDLFRKLHAKNRMGKAGNAWLGCFMKQEYQLIVASGDKNELWQFGLGEISDSAALVWPCYVLARKQDRHYWRALGPDNDEVKLYPRHRSFLLPIVDMKKTYCYTYTWQSPLQIAKNHPQESFEMMGLKGPAVVAVSEEKWDSLDKVAARNAFWDIGSMTLWCVADHLGMQPPTNSDLHGLLHFLVKNILHLNDKQTSDILLKRMKLPFCNDQEDNFLDLDEAFDIMDSDEKTECTNHAKKVKTARGTQQEFEESWKAMRDLVMPAPLPEPKAKAKARAKAKAQAPEYPGIPFGDLRQANLKPLVPPGGSLWRDNAGGWDAHYPPFRRQCFSWSKWGARNSAIYCLRYLWRGWMKVKNKSLEDVPVDGLFDDSRIEHIMGEAASSSRGSS